MTQAVAEKTLSEALAAFALSPAGQSAVRFGEGHINDTFLTRDGEGRKIILQRVSLIAFHQPELLMENIVNVTRYLAQEIARQGGDPRRETLTVVPTSGGAASFTDSAGGVWRAFLYVEGSVCYQTA